LGVCALSLNGLGLLLGLGPRIGASPPSTWLIVALLSPSWTGWKKFVTSPPWNLAFALLQKFTLVKKMLIRRTTGDSAQKLNIALWVMKTLVTSTFAPPGASGKTRLSLWRLTMETPSFLT
jgi:hypothetical protein